MIGLLQRVSRAEVFVAQESVARIDRGLLVLLGVQRSDDQARADRLLDRLLTYRVFPDQAGKMNLSLLEIGGGLLLVPQFTLAADTRKGRRPGFSHAATPDVGHRLFYFLIDKARGCGIDLSRGWFGSDIIVSLVIVGSVTFLLES